MSTSNTERQLGAGGVFAAAVLLMLVGAWQILTAISALAKDEIYVTGFKYVWQFNLTSWGWIHLILGALLILVGIFVLRGALWATVIGIVLAVLSALANFMWIPYQPIWAIISIAVDVFIIWALAMHRKDVRTLGY